MKRIRFLTCWSILAAGLLTWPASAQHAPVVHDPAVHIGAGLKKELIAGITEADFLKLGDKPRVVKITLVVAYSDANSWMNLNGDSHGKATYTVPVGWTVEVTYINPSPSPHSAVVVEREMVRKVQVGDPIFKGASTRDPVSGMSASKAVFTFTASDPGRYAIACGIPTHALSGHWVALSVSADATTPTLERGNGPPREAR